MKALTKSSNSGRVSLRMLFLVIVPPMMIVEMSEVKVVR